MSNTKVVKDVGAVIYIEPNYGNDSEATYRKDAETNEWTVSETRMRPPKLENYCVAVELSVIDTPRSNNGEVTSDGNTYIMSWDGEKANLSFFSGSEIRSGQYYTTAPYEYTTYKDALDNSTKASTTECFGINSIDVAYNNYAVPQVTLEFTDVRGMSLFMPEEMRHNLTQGGIESSANPDIIGSFFKCFFKFPFPKFQFTMKGFYGEPTSYELTCCDFRARFDCNSGNFVCTVKLIGYAFSVLNDINMNHLVAAPHTTIGETYWQTETENGRFMLDNGDGDTKPIPKITNIIQKVNSIRKNLGKLQLSDPVYRESVEIDERKTQIDTVINNINVLKSIIKDNANSYNVSFESCNEDIVIVFPTYVLSVQYDELEEFITSIYEQINSINESLTNGEPSITTLPEYHFIQNDIVFTRKQEEHRVAVNVRVTSSLKTIQELASGFRSTSVSELKKKLVESHGSIDYDNYRFLGINITDLAEAIKEEKNTVAQQFEDNQNEIKQKENSIIANALGFKPTVENCTKTLLAHFETLSHCIYETAKKVGQGEQSKNRTLATMGIDDTDVKLHDDIVPPYPRVEIVKQDTSGNQCKEDGWLGNLTDENVAPEITLVEDFISAQNKVVEIFSRAEEDAIIESGATGIIQQVSSTKHVGGVIDLMQDESWIGDVDTSDLGEIIALMTIRAFTTIGMNREATQTYNDTSWENSGKKYAINDAKEFADKFKNPSSDLLLALSEGGIFNDGSLFELENHAQSSNFIDCLLGKNTTFYKNGKRPWLNGAMIENDGSDYVLSKDIKITKNIRGSIISDIIQTEGVSKRIFSEETKYGREVGKNYFHSVRFGQKSLVDDVSSINTDGIFKLVWYNYKDYVKFVQALDDNGNAKDILDLFKPLDYIGNSKFQNWDEFYPGFWGKNGLLTVKNIESNKLRPSYDGSYSNILPSTPLSSNETDFKGELIGSDKHNFGSISFETNDMDDVAEEFIKNDNEEGYRLLKLGGIDKNGNISRDCCIFGSEAYYSCENDKQKAFLFLLSTLYDESYEGFSFALKRIISNKIDINKLQIRDYDNLCGYVPYFMVLLMGAYLHLSNEVSANDKSVFGLAFNKFKKFVKGVKYNGYNIHNLRIEIKLALNTEFIKWYEGRDGSPYTFGKIRNSFELKSVNGTTLTSTDLTNVKRDFANGKTYEQIASNASCKTFEKYLEKHFHKGLFDSYFSIGYAKGDLQLYMRPNGTFAKTLFSFVYHPCIYLKSTTSIYTDANGLSGKRAKVNKDILRQYASSFLGQLQESYENLIDNAVENPESNVDLQATTDNIRIGVYKYHKILYDNWLSGNEEAYWKLEQFFEDNWHFIDAYYNRVGQAIDINITQFCDDILYSEAQEGYTLLSFMSKVYATCRFGLYTVQNFLDFTNKEKFSKMFDPIPYEEVDWLSVKKHPDFILMYTYEPSTKLEFDDSAYSGDSFTISDEETWPEAISMKNLDNGYRIPAFGVTYGMQNQSYFKNIEVGMENPVVTEQSLRAQFALASAAVGKKNDGTVDNTENTNHIHFLGQDAFSIYANNSYTCTVTMMGCAWIQPLLYFQLNNVPLFRGTYLIQKVSHHIEPNNMETTFVGTRLARVQSPKVGENVVVAPNGSNGGADIDIIEEANRQASIGNNCDYKYFPPSNVYGGGAVDISKSIYEVAPNIGSLSHKGKRGSDYYKRKHTVKEVLTAVAYAATGTNDEVAFKLALTVYYNWYQKKGWDYLFGSASRIELLEDKTCNWLKGEQPNYANNLRTYTEDVFTKSPSVLVGMRTNVANPVPIYKNGKKTSKKTASSVITLENVQKIWQYAGSKSYKDDKTGKMVAHEGGEYSLTAYNNSKGCKDAKFIYNEYQLQHDWNNNTLSHVMLGSEKCWEAVETKPNASNTSKDPSDSIMLVLQSIRNTMMYSENINYDTSKLKVEKGTSKGKSSDSIYLTSTEKGALAQVFDIAVNCYYNDLSYIIWIYNNDASEEPYKLYLSAKNANGKKTIGCCKNDLGDFIKFTAPNFDGMNEKFKMTLKKKYGPSLSEATKNKFTSDCKNIGGYINRNNTVNEDFIKNVNEHIFDVKLEECVTNVNNGTVSGNYNNIDHSKINC